MHIIPAVHPPVEAAHVATRPVAPLGLAGAAWIVTRPVPVERDDTLTPVGVWIVDLDDARAPQGSELAAGLSGDELARASSRSIDVARRWLRSHFALRRILGACLDQDPASLKIESTELGQPFVDGARGFAFSLSHSWDRALVAVSRAGAVGVDVERIRPGLHETAIAQRIIGGDASETLEKTTPSSRTDAFFRMWVRHEAALKCRGVGLVAAIGSDVADGLAVTDVEVGVGYAGALAIDGPALLNSTPICFDWTL